MLRKPAILLTVVSLLSGCATGIELSKYREMEGDQKICEIRPPDYVVNKKKPKVAILPLEDATPYKDKLSKPATETLTQVLTSGTGLQVVERSQVSKLFEEYKFKSNLSGEVDPAAMVNLVNDVDFVILGSIPSASVSAKFTEASSYTDKKGVSHTTPPSCDFTGEATVNVRAVSTANGSIYKVFKPFNGKVTGSTEVRSTYECRVRDPLQLALQAVSRSIERGKDSFMDAFPNYGYASKTMTNPQNGRDRIAQITLGRNDGVKAGDKVVLAKFVKSYDRIKKTESLAIEDLGEATISETGLGDDQSYVSIPEELSGEVKVGYIVKTKANRGMFRNLGL